MIMITVLATNIATLFAPNAILQMCFPFETLAHPDDLVAKLYQPLQASMPDLERRDSHHHGGRIKPSPLGRLCGLLYRHFFKTLANYSPNPSTNAP